MTDEKGPAQEAADTLTERILDGTLKPGDSVTKQVVTARAPVVREILATRVITLLEERGLVEITANWQARVRKITSADVRVIAGAILAIQLQQPYGGMAAGDLAQLAAHGVLREDEDDPEYTIAILREHAATHCRNPLTSHQLTVLLDQLELALRPKE